jgi:prepilin-type N-terminal cleavage/methylation domain-containing protein
MIRKHRELAYRGFTLIEALVTLAILAIAMVLGIPALSNLISRSRLQSAAQELAVLTQRARLEAIKRRVQTVVEVDPATGAVFAYADVDGADESDPPDLVFNPVSGALSFDTDYRIGQTEPRNGVEVAAPTGGGPAIDGLTPDPGGTRVAVFRPTGAAEAAGGFRLGDAAGLNFLEVRIEPAGTGRVELRKWDRDKNEWYAHREGGRPWTWYTGP